MKQTIKTSRTAGYLEKLFRTLNDHYFGSTIEEPIITIQSTPRAYGHITVAKAWRKANGDERHELNIAAGTLDRPIEEIVATLLHEMVHLMNLQNGVQDLGVLSGEPRPGVREMQPSSRLMRMSSQPSLMMKSIKASVGEVTDQPMRSS